jgi:hypothetical protein
MHDDFIRPEAGREPGSTKTYYAGDPAEIEANLANLRAVFPGLNVTACTDPTQNTFSEGTYNVTYVLVSRDEASQRNVGKPMYNLQQELNHLAAELEIKDGQRVTAVCQDAGKSSSESPGDLRLMPAFAEDGKFLASIIRRKGIQQLVHAIASNNCKGCGPEVHLLG